MDELLSIGDFSARCGLSAKMLRSYAAAGLLVPAAVDGSSGYRYYSTGQLHQARVIALLRQAGIPVDDITVFYDNPDALQLDRWEREVVQESTARRQALAEARAALVVVQESPAARTEASRKGFEMATHVFPGTSTHIGGRETNQDAVLVSDGLFAVADGIGGLHNGEVASRLALDTLDAAFKVDRSVSGLLNACGEANRAVGQHQTADGEEATMGTTLVALAMTSDVKAVVLHTGDSRLYRLRRGRLEQLTHDHTVTAELVRTGELSEEDAQSHPYRHVLTRAIGVSPDVDIDYAGVSCEPGDRLILCTDGLFKVLSADEMKGVLASEAEPQQAADALVHGAAERGAEDNVTAMVLDIH